MPAQRHMIRLALKPTGPGSKRAPAPSRCMEEVAYTPPSRNVVAGREDHEGDE